MIRQTQGILKKKNPTRTGAGELFFSPPKETTPREEKLHLIAITCGIRGRFFFSPLKRTNYRGCFTAMEAPRVPPERS